VVVSKPPENDSWRNLTGSEATGPAEEFTVRVNVLMI
jgi:hypothetical protein